MLPAKKSSAAIAQPPITVNFSRIPVVEKFRSFVVVRGETLAAKPGNIALHVALLIIWGLAIYANTYYLFIQNETWFGTCPPGFWHTAKHVIGMMLMTPLCLGAAYLFCYFESIMKAIETAFPDVEM